ncbi:serine-rich adhesin for platelets isoform X3 [Aedes albopictus]|uniref:Uncharacterized protein n=1 Tax=Aedes albopictus TaxID=7160 RepID=A0ABM1Y4N5_AEDAL
MVSSTITLDKKSSSSSSSAAAASATAQASAEQNSNSIISIPLNATTSTNGTNCSDSSAASSSALGLSEQKISILFPKCKPRIAEQHYQANASSGMLGGNNSIINNNNSHSNRNSMSTITSNSKSDITGTSSSLTTPTSLTSSSYTLNSTSYGMDSSAYRGNGGSAAAYDLLGSRQELSSRLNNNQYESGRSSSRHTNSVDKYSFYYNSQPPPLSTSPTENNANAAGSSSHFLPSDDEDDENDQRKDSYPRHTYYTSRHQSHYYNLPKQDPGTPSSSSRYHWDLSSSSALSYSTPISSTVTSTIGGGKRPSNKSAYTKVLQSPLEDESDIEDKLKYFNYQNEMHNSSSSSTTNVVNMAVSSSSTAPEKPSGIYSNYKTNEMIVFNDIDEERRRVQQQQHQAHRQENDHKHTSNAGGLHVSSVATVDDLDDDGISLHSRRNQPPQLLQDGNGGAVAGGCGGGFGDGDNGSNETSSSAHKTAPAATTVASNSGSNIMEYEGSPRRFGLSLNEDSSSYYMSSNYKLNLTSPSLLTPPRPGFPQRVIPPHQQQQQQSTNNSNTSAATTPTPIGTGAHHHPYHPVTRSPTLLEQVSSGLNSSVTFDANALLSEFDAKRAAVSASTISINGSSTPNSAAVAAMDSAPLEVNKLNVIRLDSDYRSEDLEEIPTKRSTPEIKPTLGLISTTADDNPTFGAGSFTTPITASSTFDYLYEFSETRKVLEEFFKCPTTEDVEKAFEKFSDYNESGDDVESLDIHYEYPAELDGKALETTYIGSTVAAEQQKTMTTSSGGGARQQDISAAIVVRKSPINNNASDVEADGDDDDVANGEEDGEEDGGVEDDEDDDDDAEGGNNLKYMINVKSKPRIKNGYTSFRKKKQEKKLAGMGSNALSGIVTVSGGNDDDNDGEDEEEIDIYSANHHHHHSYHLHQQQQQRLQQQTQEHQQQQQQHQNLSNVRQHVILQQQQHQQQPQQYQEHERHFSLYLDPGSRASSCDVINESNLDSTQFLTNGNGKKLRSNGGGSGNGKKPLARRQSKNFNYSPDTTDYESNCGDYDSEISLKYGSEYGGIMVNGAAASEMMCDDLNNGVISSASTTGINSSTMIDNGVNNATSAAGSAGNYARYYTSMPVLEDGLSSGHVSDTENNNPGILPTPDLINSSHKLQQAANSYSLLTSPTGGHTMKPISSSPVIGNHNNNLDGLYGSNGFRMNGTAGGLNSSTLQNNKIFKNRDPELESLYTINTIQSTPPPPAPAPHRKSSIDCDAQTTLQQLQNQQQASSEVQAALKDIRTCLQRNKPLASPTHPQAPCPSSQQTQQQPTHQQSTMKNYEKHSMLVSDKLESPVPSISPVWIPRSRESKLVPLSPTMMNNSSPGLLLPTTPTAGDRTERSTNLSTEKDSLLHGNSAKITSALDDDEDPDTDLETDRLLGHQRLDDQGFYDDNSKSWTDRKTRSLLHKLSPKQQTGPVGANGGTSLYGSKPNNQGSLLRQGLSTLLSPASAVTVAQPASSLPEIVTSSKASPGLLSSTVQNSMNNNSIKSGNLISLHCPNENCPSSRAGSHQQSPTKIENQVIESGSPNGSDGSKSDKKKRNKTKEGLLQF